jgi:hypothetical protein
VLTNVVPVLESAKYPPVYSSVGQAVLKMRDRCSLVINPDAYPLTDWFCCMIVVLKMLEVNASAREPILSPKLSIVGGFEIT